MCLDYTSNIILTHTVQHEKISLLDNASLKASEIKHRHQQYILYPYPRES